MMPRPFLASACLLLAGAGWLPAQTRFSVLPRSVPAGGAGERISLRLDNDIAIRGYAFAVQFDPARLAVTDIDRTGTLAQDAEYFAGKIDGAAGKLGYGCVFSFGAGASNVLPAGTERLLARLVVDVTGPAGATTDLVLADVHLDPSRPDVPPVRNMVSDEDGDTVLPALVNGTITIEDRTPVIDALSDNAGRPGKMFRVAGSFLGEPGLTVTVCGVPAAAALEPDGATLLVTAPDCGSVGFVPVEVCTLRGCDAEPNGFEYERPEPVLVRGNTNGDAAVDLSDGVFTLLFLFLGGEPSACFDSMDANDDGAVDLSDAAYIFNFLFTGGADIPPPYPLPGPDPTLDALPEC
jgi:hypothetical protein